MDKIDRAILNVLIKDGRMSYNQISERVNLSASACLRRVRSLCQRGIIKHFSFVLNSKAIGYGVRSFLSIKVNRHQVHVVQEFLGQITAYPEVVACHQVSGQTDFIVEVESRDLDSYTNFINQKILSMPAVLDASSAIVLKDFKMHRTEI